MPLNFDVKPKERLDFDIKPKRKGLITAEFAEKSPIFKFIDKILPPKVQAEFLRREEALRPTLKELKKTVGFLGKQLTFGSLRKLGALAEEAKGVKPEERKVGITPAEEKAAVKTGVFPLRQLRRPISAIQAGVRARIEDKPLKEIGKEAVRGFALPEDIEPITRKIPFSKFELEGDWTRLIPRATLEAVEELVLFSLTFGGGIKSIRNRIKATQTKTGITRMENFIKALEERGAKIPALSKLSSKDKALAFINAGQTDPRVGNVVGRVVGSEIFGTELFAGVPAKFNIGDLVRVGKDFGKIIKLEGAKAILSVAGKEVSRDIAELALAEKPVIPAFRLLTFSLTVRYGLSAKLHLLFLQGHLYLRY